MHATPIRRRWAAAGFFGVGLGLMAAALAGPASADHVPAPEPVEGNLECPAGSTVDFKIDSPFEAGTYEFEGFEVTISNVVLNDDDEVLQFDFIITPDAGEDPVLVNRVLVKTANESFVYTFDPPVASATHLTTGPEQHGISHVTFCLGPVVNPTDGGTDGTTDDDTTDGDTTTGGTTTGGTTTGGTTTGGTTTGGVSPTIVTQPPTQVAGAVVEPQALPATGTNDRSLAIIGAALILIGGGTLLYRRGLLHS